MNIIGNRMPEKYCFFISRLFRKVFSPYGIFVLWIDQYAKITQYKAEHRKRVA
jgi:hypothetical protein